MSQRVLNYTVREERKKEVSKVREAGNVPAVIYGKNEPICISVNEKEFLGLFESRVLENLVITLKGSEGDRKVLVKDYVADYLKGIVVHIDFFEFNEERKVRCSVPVDLQGNPVGVRSGGLLEVKRDMIDIIALPGNVPETFPLDINELNLGESIRVRDLAVNDNIQIATPSDVSLIAISIPRGARGKVDADAE